MPALSRKSRRQISAERFNSLLDQTLKSYRTILVSKVLSPNGALSKLLSKMQKGSSTTSRKSSTLRKRTSSSSSDTSKNSRTA